MEDVPATPSEDKGERNRPICEQGEGQCLQNVLRRAHGGCSVQEAAIGDEGKRQYSMMCAGHDDKRVDRLLETSLGYAMRAPRGQHAREREPLAAT